jgi:hypothetical protein
MLVTFLPHSGRKQVLILVNFLERLKEKYLVFRTGAKALDYDNLLAIVPKTHFPGFVFSLSCFYAETLEEIYEALKSAVTFSSFRNGTRCVVTLVYVNQSNVNFSVIGSPWSILEAYLKRVSELTGGMHPFIFRNFNYDFSDPVQRWQTELMEGLTGLG